MCTIAFLRTTLLEIEVEEEEKDFVAFVEGDIEYEVHVTEVGSDKVDLEFYDGSVAKDVPSDIFEYVEDEDEYDLARS